MRFHRRRERDAGLAGGVNFFFFNTFSRIYLRHVVIVPVVRAAYTRERITQYVIIM